MKKFKIKNIKSKILLAAVALITVFSLTAMAFSDVSQSGRLPAKETVSETVKETEKPETTKAAEKLKKILEESVIETEPVTAAPETVPETEAVYVEPVYEEPEVYYEAPVVTEAPAAVPVTEAAPVYEAPAAVSGAGKYAGLYITDQERLWLAQIVYHESNNQCFEGQQAVAEVVLNRVINPRFPNTIYEVLNAPNQFVSTYALSYITPNETNFAAVDSALLNGNILPADVVYFATTPLNGRVWGRIQGHVFCYI